MTLLPKQSNNKNPIDLYGEIVDDLPGLICFGNRLGGYFNKQWRDYTGAIAGEHGAADWLDALHPDDRERLAAQWRQAIVALSSFAGEARLRDRSGAYRWFMLAFNARQDGMALEPSWYLTATDIHPQMLQRQQNVQALSIQQDMLDASVDCIKVINHDGTLRHMNRSGSLALGLDPGQKSLACPGWGCCRPRSGAAAAKRCAASEPEKCALHGIERDAAGQKALGQHSYAGQRRTRHRGRDLVRLTRRDFATRDGATPVARQRI